MKRIIHAMLLALPAMLLYGSDAQAQSPFGAHGCGGFCFKFLGGLHQHGPLYNYGPYAGYYPFEPYGPWNAQLQYTGPYPGNPGCGWNGLCGGRGGCGAAGGCDAGGCGSRGFGNIGAAGCGTGGCGSSGISGLFSGLSHPFSHRGAEASCSTCNTGFGKSAFSTFTGVFHRSHPLSHKAKISTGCSAASPVGCGTPVKKSCGGGCSASALGASQLEAVSLVGAIETTVPGQFRRER
jgi:hypothetical protein